MKHFDILGDLHLYLSTVSQFTVWWFEPLVRRHIWGQDNLFFYVQFLVLVWPSSLYYWIFQGKWVQIYFPLKCLQGYASKKNRTYKIILRIILTFQKNCYLMFYTGFPFQVFCWDVLDTRVLSVAKGCVSFVIQNLQLCNYNTNCIATSSCKVSFSSFYLLFFSVFSFGPFDFIIFILFSLFFSILLKRNCWDRLTAKKWGLTAEVTHETIF